MGPYEASREGREDPADGDLTTRAFRELADDVYGVEAGDSRYQRMLVECLRHYKGHVVEGEIPPEELLDFLALERLHWSWAEWEATPRYIRMAFGDLALMLPNG